MEHVDSRRLVVMRFQMQCYKSVRTRRRHNSSQWHNFRFWAPSDNDIKELWIPLLARSSAKFSTVFWFDYYMQAVGTRKVCAAFCK